MAEEYTFNLTTKRWIESYSNPEPLSTGFPIWGYGDTRSINVTFVTQNGIDVQVVTSLLSARLGIASAAGATVLTSATAGTPSAAWAFPFTVDMAQSGINTFLGSLTERMAVLEFRLADVIGPRRYQTQVKILQQVLSDTASDPIAPEVALTRNEAAGIYVPKEWPAGMRQIVTTDSGRQFINYPGDDGQWHLDPI